MEQPHTTSTTGESTNTLSSLGNLTLTDVGRLDNLADVLSATAKHISTNTVAPSSSRRSSLVQRCNDSSLHRKLDGVLAKFFHPLELSSSPAIISYLLMSYSQLRLQHQEELSAKKLYEDHIAFLKEKNAEMEGKLKENADSKISFDARWCQSCDELRRSKDTLSVQYSRLKGSYDEVRILALYIVIGLGYLLCILSKDDILVLAR